MNSIEVKCFATLAHYAPAGGFAKLAATAAIGDLLRELGIADGEVAIIFVNGAHATESTALRDGDRVGLFPAVGGG